MTLSPTKYDKNTLFREFEEYLKKKEIEETVPLSIFSDKLSPFETVVKYLVENLKYSYSEIGRLLLKDRQVVWTTYKRAVKKHPRKFSKLVSDYNIPLLKLSSDKFSIAELIVAYLKDLNLSNSKIAALMKKDARTIWTWYDRYKKK